MNILDYYSLLRYVEENLKGQSEEIANIFIKADFNPKYVSLNDGIIEKNQIVFYQKVYEIIRTMVSSEKNNIIDKINNFTRLNKVNKKQEEILSNYFSDDTIINDDTGKKEKNGDYILYLHDKILYEYEDFLDYEEEDIHTVLDEYVQKNSELNDRFKNNLNDLFASWKEVKK